MGELQFEWRIKVGNRRSRMKAVWKGLPKDDWFNIFYKGDTIQASVDLNKDDVKRIKVGIISISR